MELLLNLTRTLAAVGENAAEATQLTAQRDRIDRNDARERPERQIGNSRMRGLPHGQLQPISWRGHRFDCHKTPWRKDDFFLISLCYASP